MQYLAQWEQGKRMRQMCRQKLYSFLNWTVQRGHLKPIYSPPCDPSRSAEAQAHWVSP